MTAKKVVIIGGGISGLAHGIVFLNNGYQVSIYEKNKNLEYLELGHNISLHDCSHYCMEELGFPKIEYFKRYNGVEDVKYYYGDSMLKNVSPSHVLFSARFYMRGKIILGLTDHFTELGGKIFLDRQFKHFDDREVYFKNAEKERYDILIGADGKTSKVKCQLLNIERFKTSGVEYKLTAPANIVDDKFDYDGFATFVKKIGQVSFIKLPTKNVYSISIMDSKKRELPELLSLAQNSEIHHTLKTILFNHDPETVLKFPVIKSSPGEINNLPTDKAVFLVGEALSCFGVGGGESIFISAYLLNLTLKKNENLNIETFYDLYKRDNKLNIRLSPIRYSPNTFVQLLLRTRLRYADLNKSENLVNLLEKKLEQVQSYE
jgi:2-polyprenyl-6-methoxyphenol hydroxylase-like FAD-dependent oxidoreductase